LSDSTPPIRRRFDLRGQVQGVGFRPYVYRLATMHGLAGFVGNDSSGAFVEVEGLVAAIDAFAHDLVAQLPPLARITELVQRDLPPTGEIVFRIRASEARPDERPEVTPDAATCADCLRELFDPADRRYRYPFINCTNCGPRYSIIRDVPYDRPQTTMSVFPMCARCAAEYADPASRRFHAQPNACAVCGPELRLVRTRETTRVTADVAEASPTDPIPVAARLLHGGGIVAIKGIGGYHLACRADCEDVVQRLRERKLRDGKPLAVMVPNLDVARRLCRLTPADEDALRSVAAPIVLALKADGHGLAASISAGCRDFGLMLPYAPVQHLLFAEGLGPLVMTSANLAGQPLTYRDEDAVEDLADVADAFLVHNRDIFRPIDDAVVVTFRDEVVPIRRARGYAPRPLRLVGLAGCCRDVGPPTADTGVGRYSGRRVLAVGGELKATVCLLQRGEAILSEHLGDLTNPAAYRHFVAAIDRLKQLAGCEPEVVACDLHPRYLSTEYARRCELPVVAVQHHHAHIASVMAEWGELGPVIGLSCDGAGYGTDGAVWGCEALFCERGDFERIGHLEYFPLVGGDLAASETWRPAAALVRAAFGEDWRGVWDEVLSRRWRNCSARTESSAGDEGESVPDGRKARDAVGGDVEVFERQLVRGINTPSTSSLGRVFDAVAFLLGLCDRNRHEAEAAMAVEAAATEHGGPVTPLSYAVDGDGDHLVASLVPTIRDIVRASGDSESQPALLAARFHETVAQMLAESARLAATPRGMRHIALSGGCFANRRLLVRVVELLEADGFIVLYHREVPSGDGGLALGQAFVAAWRGS
jgi:hydrogenase maturation protein HypF